MENRSRCVRCAIAFRGGATPLPRASDIDEYGDRRAAEAGGTVAIAAMSAAARSRQGAIDAAGLYVLMTRGRESNDVWVVIEPTSPADALDVLTDVVQRRWVDEPAIEHLPAAEIELD